MGVLLRIMTWNIAEGNMTGQQGDNSALPALATEIRARNPDVVFLNEVRNERGFPFGNGVNQVIRLSELTGMPHRHWANTNALGAVGYKVVGILSRYPVEAAIYHPVKFNGDDTGFGTLETSIVVDGRRIHVFSTRFSPIHTGNPNFDFERERLENAAGHQQSIDMLRARDPSVPLIFGGDFNTSPGNLVASGHLANFTANSGLINTMTEKPDPLDVDPEGVDFIFYRGPYNVMLTERRNPSPNPTDHSYVLAELRSPPTGFSLTYGGTFKLRHENTNRVLHSHAFNYGHPGTSGQQQVTGFDSSDDGDWWRIKGPHGQPSTYKQGQLVQSGDILRLEHVGTKRNLHSHVGHPSPVTQQQEVTCFGDNGLGDENDNWRLEVDGGGPWTPGRKVRLIHVATNHALHSHWGQGHPQWTRSQQEVTCYDQRDDNDWWTIFASL